MLYCCIKPISLLLKFLMCIVIKPIKHKISKVFTVTCVDVLLYRSNSQVVQFSTKTVHKTASSLHLSTHLLARTKYNSVPSTVIYRLTLNIKSGNYPPF